MAVLVPYFLFTVAYWAAGGHNEYGGSYIYPVLNWDNLPLTIPFVMGILTAGVIFFSHSCLDVSLAERRGDQLRE
ncbi:hypothetical protein DAPPUDRAFT_300907 [Daphnia pulex]|uniref:Uncharacterized protein n=1 Tax=Daphnia pulex TaxID=6669 RepID=E9HFD7_DAPPU|nr:hypothetical protein DAPPUDRAFT_300907 [Daphnia pulex]|eukprot:EFX69513.1 hypothetical protein DAPPUDRAFT_300907 [Daphnia pulex]